MSEVLRKLQIDDSTRLFIFGAPAEFQAHLDELDGDIVIATRLSDRKRFPFVLFFVRECAEIATYAPKAIARLEEDGLLWFAYTKKSSKRYTSDIDRDDSWQALGEEGFEGVRQVAIDADWSALRFRHVDHIKTLKRDSKRAMTAQGKQRTKRG